MTSLNNENARIGYQTGKEFEKYIPDQNLSES
jgi:hypothetical protein